MKAWEVEIATYEITDGGWRWGLSSPRDYTHATPLISVLDRKLSALRTQRGALAAARRVMKRMNLVEKAQARKVT